MVGKHAKFLLGHVHKAIAAARENDEYTAEADSWAVAIRVMGPEMGKVAVATGDVDALRELMTVLRADASVTAVEYERDVKGKPMPDVLLITPRY